MHPNFPSPRSRAPGSCRPRGPCHGAGRGSPSQYRWPVEAHRRRAPRFHCAAVSPGNRRWRHRAPSAHDSPSRELRCRCRQTLRGPGPRGNLARRDNHAACGRGTVAGRAGTSRRTGSRPPRKRHSRMAGRARRLCAIQCGILPLPGGGMVEHGLVEVGHNVARVGAQQRGQGSGHHAAGGRRLEHRAGRGGGDKLRQVRGIALEEQGHRQCVVEPRDGPREHHVDLGHETPSGTEKGGHIATRLSPRSHRIVGRFVGERGGVQTRERGVDGTAAPPLQWAVRSLSPEPLASHSEACRRTLRRARGCEPRPCRLN